MAVAEMVDGVAAGAVSYFAKIDSEYFNISKEDFCFLLKNEFA